MCLVLNEECLKNNELCFKTVNKDIVCYKVLTRIFETGEIKTPFAKTVLSEEVMNGEELFVAEGYPKISFRHKGPSVKHGLIHTFVTKKEAISLYETLKRYSIDDRIFFLAKCIIPKGTKYVSGIMETMKGDKKAYGSESIKFVKLYK